MKKMNDYNLLKITLILTLDVLLLAQSFVEGSKGSQTALDNDSWQGLDHSIGFTHNIIEGILEGSQGHQTPIQY